MHVLPSLPAAEAPAPESARARRRAFCRRHSPRLLRAARPWSSASHSLAHALCPFPVTVLHRSCTQPPLRAPHLCSAHFAAFPRHARTPTSLAYDRCHGRTARGESTQHTNVANGEMGADRQTARREVHSAGEKGTRIKTHLGRGKFRAVHVVNILVEQI